MIDTGSSETFMDLTVAQIRKFTIFEKNRSIPLADKTHSAKIVGQVIVELELNGCTHKNIVIELVKDLCTEVIIGRDVLGEHKQVVLNFNGPQEELVIGAIPTTVPEQTNSSLYITPHQ